MFVLEKSQPVVEDCEEGYTFFWRSQSPFSQWHPASFVIGSITYNCAEQYMMHQKAGKWWHPSCCFFSPCVQCQGLVRRGHFCHLTVSVLYLFHINSVSRSCWTCCVTFGVSWHAGEIIIETLRFWQINVSFSQKLLIKYLYLTTVHWSKQSTVSPKFVFLRTVNMSYWQNQESIAAVLFQWFDTIQYKTSYMHPLL